MEWDFQSRSSIIEGSSLLLPLHYRHKAIRLIFIFHFGEGKVCSCKLSMLIVLLHSLNKKVSNINIKVKVHLIYSAVWSPGDSVVEMNPCQQIIWIKRVLLHW